MELTRKQLVELLSVSECLEWTTPIKKYLDRVAYAPDERTVIIKQSDINLVFEKGTTCQIEAIEKFGILNNNVYSIVDLASALRYADKHHEDVIPYTNPITKQQKKLNSQAILWFVIDLFNKSTGKEIDWKNSNQYKYEPYWHIKDGFRLGFLADRLGDSYAGSQEVFLNKKHVEHVTKYFFEDYKNVKF